MSVRGKSINLFLMDGTPNGRIKCTLANWTEAVVFTTSNNSFGPTEISYLENKFCGLAVDAQRYTVKNGNDPTSGNITEEKECELEEFIDYAKIVMGALGYKLFEPLTEKTKVVAVEEHFEEEVILFLKRKSSKSGIVIEARCKQTNEGFVVLKGSIIETIDSQSIPNTIKERREKAEKRKLMKKAFYKKMFFLKVHRMRPHLLLEVM